MKKAEIAAAFVALHKESDLADWNPVGIYDDNKKLGAIYKKLEQGEYGCVHDDGETDDEGNVVVEPTEFWVEIPAHESATGNAVEFYWRNK